MAHAEAVEYHTEIQINATGSGSAGARPRVSSSTRTRNTWDVWVVANMKEIMLQHGLVPAPPTQA